MISTPKTRNIPILWQFKMSCRHQPLKVGEQLSVSERKYNIILTRIRHKCISLNADHFQVYIIPYSNCSYGVPFESVEYKFLECNLYNTQRWIILQTIAKFQTVLM